MASSPNTKSTSTTETVRGGLRFSVAGNAGKPGLSPGAVSMSKAFSVGGFNWSICYYPGDDDVAHVSVFVRLVTANARARAMFDLRLVDRATGLPRSVRRFTEPVAFDSGKAKKRHRGARKFMARRELLASPYLDADDRLTIECVLDVVQEPRLAETAAEVVAPPPPDLWKDLGRLLQTREAADVAFDVQGEAFHAHRVVLVARSPVFKAELSRPRSPPAANQEGTMMQNVTVHDMRPPVFKALLHFVYTDTLPSLDHLGFVECQDLVQDLHKAAVRYAMNRLKEICTLILWKVIDAKTVVAAVAIAGRHHHCEALGVGDACVQFMPSAGFEG